MSTSVNVGDKVQIRGGGMDVTNGVKAVAGSMYGQGGPLWATVTKVTENWVTNGKFGLPQKVTKVTCANSGIVVWQVRPEDIAKQKVDSTAKPKTNTDAKKEKEKATKKEPSAPTSAGKEALTPTAAKKAETYKPPTSSNTSSGGYAPKKNSGDWGKGGKSSTAYKSNTVVNDPSTQSNTAIISSSVFAYDADVQTPSYKQVSTAMKNMPPSDIVSSDRTVYKTQYKTSWQSAGRRNEMQNKSSSLIQNQYGYPVISYENGNTGVQMYDYQYIPGDPRYKGRASKNLETELMKFRASVGLQVHGDNDMARSVKYYLYNRFKTPDPQLAHNRTFTHVFFTRPDTNLMNAAGTAPSEQAMNHTDTAMIWRRYPDLFKMLTDASPSTGRCKDANNFIMLLSNQISSVGLKDEEIASMSNGRSWNNHEIKYGKNWTGRTADTVTCVFNETADYSITNLMHLWMTYIDNVSRGAWSPYYGNTKALDAKCHVHTRTIDYASSMYVFKVGPDGEDILYWTKYFGIFPISLGTSALGFEEGQVDSTPKLSVSFAYSFKRDMNPISLAEFNHNAKISGAVTNLSSFDPNLAHSSHPFVGTPYIELTAGNPGSVTPNDVVSSGFKRIEKIRLKFMKDSLASGNRSESKLFKANLNS